MDVLNTCIKLRAFLHNLQERIELIDLNISEIQRTEEGLKNDKNFTVELLKVVCGGLFSFKVMYVVCKENLHYFGFIMPWKSEHCDIMTLHCLYWEMSCISSCERKLWRCDQDREH